VVAAERLLVARPVVRLRVHFDRELVAGWGRG
jgi:hypothetical protein